MSPGTDHWRVLWLSHVCFTLYSIVPESDTHPATSAFPSRPVRSAWAYWAVLRTCPDMGPSSASFRSLSLVSQTAQFLAYPSPCFCSVSHCLQAMAVTLSQAEVIFVKWESNDHDCRRKLQVCFNYLEFFLILDMYLLPQTKVSTYSVSQTVLTQNVL